MSAELSTPLMGVREAAGLLGYESVDPVRRLIRSGELRAYKIRGRLRISQAAIEELLAGTTVAPAAAAPAPRRSPARSEGSGGATAEDTARFLLERREARRRRRGTA